MLLPTQEKGGRRENGRSPWDEGGTHKSPSPGWDWAFCDNSGQVDLKWSVFPQEMQHFSCLQWHCLVWESHVPSNCMDSSDELKALESSRGKV